MYELSLLETQKGIKYIKDLFQDNFSRALHLHRISSPIILKQNTGINDNLNGIETPVSFVSNINGISGEIPHSLAKWKRCALQRYDIPLHEGIYTDMNAIRKDETLSNIHSIYVDQWDWELRITKQERNLNILKKIVEKIYEVIVYCQKKVNLKYDWTDSIYLPEKITFITSNELYERYSNLSEKERENAIVKEYGAVFLIGIGWNLSNGKPHDLRAPDYDDWNLNGDILVYNPVTDSALELSSMGIRVDEKSIVKQVEFAKKENYLNFDFHKLVINKKIPYSIGGGIGQSRLCYFLLKKQHIGEVQASLWTDEIYEECDKKGLKLL
ncbi:MAG: aspartate--ammonia ligase [Malacoplasma sp.]|nr:aspartate--ammonia ligase [Malacoplasma sp.]